MESLTGANFCGEIAAVSAHGRIGDMTIKSPEIEVIIRRLEEEGLWGVRFHEPAAMGHNAVHPFLDEVRMCHEVIVGDKSGTAILAVFCKHMLQASLPK